MSDVTVRQFADVVGVPVDRLLTQLMRARSKPRIQSEHPTPL